MPEEPEESGFTIRDRRRFVDTGSAEAASPAAPTFSSSQETMPSPTSADDDLDEDADDEMEEQEEGELPDVYSVLAMFLGELRNLAWIRMGLVANPMSGVVERDLGQARVAIDTVTFLAGQLDSVMSHEERPELKNLVSNLQINFVEQTRRASGDANS